MRIDRSKATIDLLHLRRIATDKVQGHLAYAFPTRTFDVVLANPDNKPRYCPARTSTSNNSQVVNNIFTITVTEQGVDSPVTVNVDVSAFLINDTVLIDHSSVGKLAVAYIKEQDNHNSDLITNVTNKLKQTGRVWFGD